MIYEGVVLINIKVICIFFLRFFCEKDDRDKYCEIGILIEFVKGKVLFLIIIVFYVFKKNLYYLLFLVGYLLKWDIYMYMFIDSLLLEEFSKM